MENKEWYKSKLVWLGLIQTAIAILGLVAEFLAKGDFQSATVVLLFSGVLTAVLRIWFTSTEIKK